MNDECEVCMGENGMAVGTVTFDALGLNLVVLICRPCLGALTQTLADQWNQAIASQNAAVDAMKRMLDIEDTGVPAVDPSAPVGGCRFCSCVRYRPLPDDAELCVCDHVDDEHEDAGALTADPPAPAQDGLS